MDSAIDTKNTRLNCHVTRVRRTDAADHCFQFIVCAPPPPQERFICEPGNKLATMSRRFDLVRSRMIVAAYKMCTVVYTGFFFGGGMFAINNLLFVVPNVTLTLTLCKHIVKRCTKTVYTICICTRKINP
jgi:hypothetical protein